MTKMLYKIEFSPRVRGLGAPVVRAIVKTTGITGHFDAATGELITPDMDQIRNALPHYWLKAFDRRPNLWFPDDDNKPAHVTLYSVRWCPLVTILATPYRYDGSDKERN